MTEALKQQDTNMVNVEDFIKSIQGDDYKQHQLQRLIETNHKARALQHEKRSILYSLSTEESLQKRKDVHTVVDVVYKNVLKTDTLTQSIQDIVVSSLEQEKVYLLQQNRNYQYFDSKKLFEDNLNNPNQKSLIKSKHLTKRLMKKQKTPMQTLTYAYSAKNNSDRDDRLSKMEERMADLDYKLTLLVMNQDSVIDQVNQHTQELSDIQERLNSVEGLIKGDRKLKFYALYTSKKETSYSDLAKEVGVSKRTIIRWVKEFRSIGVI